MGAMNDAVAAADVKRQELMTELGLNGLVATIVTDNLKTCGEYKMVKDMLEGLDNDDQLGAALGMPSDAQMIKPTNTCGKPVSGFVLDRFGYARKVTFDPLTNTFRYRFGGKVHKMPDQASKLYTSTDADSVPLLTKKPSAGSECKRAFPGDGDAQALCKKLRRRTKCGK